MNRLENKNVLVTGGAGFIGSHLVDRLLENQNHVTIVDNFDPFYSGKEKNIEKNLGNPNFEFAKGDVLNYDLLRKILEKKDVVFHLAAQAGIRFSTENPLKTHMVNSTGTLNVLQAVKECGVRKIVFASSSSVYGIAKRLPIEEGYPTLPVSIYGSSKLSAENYCRCYNKLFRMNVVALRYFTVYGPRQRPDMAIYKFVKAILDGEPPMIFGDGEQTRDFTYVDDAVQGTILAAEREIEGFEVFNLGGGSRISVNKLVLMILNMLGKKEGIEPKYLDARREEVHDTFADITKAREKLGYAPKVDFKRGLENFIEWFAKNR